MALTAAEITALVNELEQLARQSGSLRELRNLLTNLSNQDLSQLTSQVQGVTDAIAAQTASNNASVFSLQARQRALEAEAQAYASTNQELQKRIKAQEAALELERAMLLTGNSTIENIKAQEAALEGLKEKIEDLNEKQRTVQQGADDVFDSFMKLSSGNLIAGLKQLGTGMSKILGDSGKAGPISSFKKELSGIAKEAAAGSGTAVAGLGALAASFVALAGALFITSEIVKLAISVENLSREIQKVTGLSKDFTNQIMANADAVRAFDPQMKMLGETTQALGKSFTDFSMLNKQVAADVTVTLTALTALGIGAGDLAKGMQLSTKALGQNADQATQTQLELNALARDIGVAPAEMAANFAAAGTQLAKLGRDGVKAFKDLAITSKITGIEVSRLLAITEKFDTFEGAAEQAGKLNAALGGNFVNAMELMTATDPAERFEMIRDSILDAGLAFDDMSYYQSKFYADAMGLNDVSELALVLSGNMESLNGEIGKTSADYENAAKMARDFQSVQDQIKNALHALIPVVQPLAELIGDLASKVSTFVTENKELLRSIGYGLLVALAAVGVALAVVAGKFILIAGVVMGVVTAIGALINVMLHKRNSPTFFESLLETADRFDKLSGSTKKFAIETENTSTSVDEMRKSMSQVSTNRAGAPIYATNNAVSNAVSSAVNSTTNNYGQQNNQNIVIELDGKKVGEGVMGKFARNAAMV